MNDEIQSNEKNKTWELVKLPINKKAIAVKWFFRKMKPEGDIDGFKARLVAKV